MAVKGHVQSGKTKFMITLSMLCLWFNMSMLIVVRNLQSDLEQLRNRINECKSIITPYLDKIRVVTSYTKSKYKSKPTIYLCLGNHTALKKMSTLLPHQSYVMCIDEVDLLDMGKETYRNETLLSLKEKSCGVFGISATILEPIGKELIKPKHVFLLNTPVDYKGILDIKFCPLTNMATYSSSIHSNLIENNEDLPLFLKNVSTRIPTKMPYISLLNICSTIQPYYELQKYISMTYPTITTLVYNAKGITISWNGITETRKETIPEIFEWMKKNGDVTSFPIILILSGDLAGRGISFTCKSYYWHIQSLYLIVSNSCDEPELIQKIRLCGRYKDNLPLELYTTHSIYSDLLKSYYRQEELLGNLVDSDLMCKDIINNTTLYKTKSTKRNMTKHCKLSYIKSDQFTSNEWKNEVYDGLEYPPEIAFTMYNQIPKNSICELGVLLKENELIENEKTDIEMETDELIRLEKKMFPLWGKNIGQTKISSFLDQLDPLHIYSHSDISHLCKQFTIPLKHILTLKYKSNSRGYGKIMIVQHNKYRLHPFLITSHQSHFHIKD